MANSTGFLLPDLNEMAEQPFLPDLNETVDQTSFPDLNNSPSSTSFLPAQALNINIVENAVAGPSSAGLSSRVGGRSSNEGHSGQPSLYPSKLASILERVGNQARLCDYEKISPIHLAEEIFSCSLGLIMPPCPGEYHIPDCSRLQYKFRSQIHKLKRKFNANHQPLYCPALNAVLNRVARTHKQQPYMKPQPWTDLVNSLLKDPIVYQIILNSGFDVNEIKEKARNMRWV